MTVVARLEVGALHPEQELGALLEQAKGNGAVVSFTGLVRATSKARSTARPGNASRVNSATPGTA